jgi:hypothetical protein
MLERKRYKGPRDTQHTMRGVYCHSSRGAGDPLATTTRRNVRFAFQANALENRPYLEEAAQVVEIPSKELVSHLFMDGGDVLDFDNASESRKRIVEDRSRAIAIHSIMAMHALIRTSIEKRLCEQSGKEWTPPKTVRVMYPRRGDQHQQ